MSEQSGSRHLMHYSQPVYGQGHATRIYDEAYASKYNSLWQENPDWAPEVEHHLESFRQVLRPGSRWLDVGCGTGWFMSQFPGTERAGLDLSPAMLRQAEAANPDALLFRQGDVKVDIPEWHDQWDLVSSTGQCWGYADHVSDVAAAVDNMARWTSPTGTLMISGPDLWDIAGLRRNEHFDMEAPLDDPVQIIATIWSFRDDAGLHAAQIWPQIDTWVRWLSAWFTRIEIVWWPHAPEFLPCPRRLLLATGKRGPGDDGPAEIVERDLYRDRPRSSDVSATTGQPSDGSDGSAGPVEQSVAREPAVAVAVTDTSEPVTAAEADPPPEPAQPQGPGPGERVPGRRLVDQPLSYLIGRIRPADPAFWRSTAKRGIRRLRR